MHSESEPDGGGGAHVTPVTCCLTFDPFPYTIGQGTFCRPISAWTSLFGRFIFGTRSICPPFPFGVSFTSAVSRLDVSSVLGGLLQPNGRPNVLHYSHLEAPNIGFPETNKLQWATMTIAGGN